jgi:hypothetical protein
MMTFIHRALLKLRPVVRTIAPSPKYLSLIAVLVLGVLGFMPGPKDIPVGDYTVEIIATHANRSLSIVHPFKLGSTVGQETMHTQTQGAYQLIVEGKDSYQYGLDQSITYRLRVLDVNGQPLPIALDNVTSTITGPSYRQVLPPTSRSGEWLEFTMRVPYKAKICTGLLFSVAVLWLTELVPLAAASLLVPVVLVVATVADPNTVFQPFFHPIVVLFFAGSLLAEGMHRTGADRIIALNILKRSSLKPAYLMITMIGL